jgi:hypothetical protein
MHKHSGTREHRNRSRQRTAELSGRGDTQADHPREVVPAMLRVDLIGIVKVLDRSFVLREQETVDVEREFTELFAAVADSDVLLEVFSRPGGTQSGSGTTGARASPLTPRSKIGTVWPAPRRARVSRCERWFSGRPKPHNAALPDVFSSTRPNKEQSQ